MEIGAQIRQRRKQLKLTMPELAKRAGITRNGIQKVERRGSDPKYSTLKRIGAALGWLLDWTETNGGDA